MYPGLKVRLIYVPGHFPLLTVRHLEGHCEKNVKTHTRAWNACESLIMIGFFWRRTTPKDICCWFGCATQENTIKLLLTSMVLWDSNNICTTKDHDYWKFLDFMGSPGLEALTPWQSGGPGAPESCLIEPKRHFKLQHNAKLQFWPKSQSLSGQWTHVDAIPCKYILIFW